LSKVTNIGLSLLLDHNFSDAYSWWVSCKPVQFANGQNIATIKERPGGVILWAERYQSYNEPETMIRQTIATLQVTKSSLDFRKNAKCIWKLKIRAMGVNTKYMSKDGYDENGKKTLFNFKK
jgi:hypothetical protein